MTIPSSARLALRTATAHDHDRVDSVFTRFDLGDRAHYAAFLKAQAAAFLPVEAGIDGIDLAPVLPDWPDRRRSAALIADLNALGETIPPVGDGPRYATIESALGAVYVLEGSRLGGRMLARSVPAGLPRRFLDAGNPGLWRTLIEALDKRLVSQEQQAAAIEAARAVFARFEASARRHDEDNRP